MALPRSPKALADLALFGLFRTVQVMLGVIPFPARVRAFGWIAAYVLGPLAGYRARVRENLRLVRPDMPARDRARLERQVLDQFGRTVMENFCPRDFIDSLQGTPVEGPGLATLDAARAAGTPVLFVSAHFGNHEAPRHALMAGGDSIAGLYRPLTNPWFETHWRQSLDTPGAAIFAQGRDGTARFTRHLRQGGWAVLFYDIHQPGGELIDFMGLPARTATSAARIALKVGAPLVPWFGIRRADGSGFRCVIEAPIPPGDPLAMTEALHRRLEARIAEHPDQWFWVHRRWKSYQKALATGRPLTG